MNVDRGGRIQAWTYLILDMLGWKVCGRDIVRAQSSLIHHDIISSDIQFHVLNLATNICCLIEPMPPAIRSRFVVVVALFGITRNIPAPCP